MKYFNPFAVAATLLVSSITSYAADPSSSSCKEIVSSQQVFECSVYEKARADKALNNQYRNLLERVGIQYKSNRMLRDEYIQRIKKSQRLWIKLRDADCELEIYQIEVGTQAYEATLNYCIVRMSDERSRYLERIAPNL
ncbi:hypothetical protein D3C85_806610 [compost metagenome]